MSARDLTLVITARAVADLHEIYAYTIDRWGENQAVTYEARKTARTVGSANAHRTSFACYKRQMENPWINLPENNPYILAADRPLLDRLTPRLTGADTLRFEVVPFPFVGDPRRAKVILLSLNPGFEESDLQNNIEHPDLVEADRKNLAFGNVPSFHGLNVKYRYGGLYGYWNPLMKKELIKAVGREQAANSVSLVNFFPYHSNTGTKLTRIWPSLNGILPSQAYSFYLVRTAIEQEKIIVLLRSWDLWEAHVPELKKYPSIRLKNHRRPYLTVNNMQHDGWARMVKAILNG